ncbi:hypothetical protein BT69DRAFT_1335524 [Atractiella rhizophila]|nr:hypothetical protein BT69DRAFT_1335524 [Atractiella rhizophila]
MSRPIPQTPSKKRSRRAEGEREEEIHITPQRPKKQRVGNFQLPSPAPSTTPTSRPATAGVISSEGKEKSQKTLGPFASLRKALHAVPSVLPSRDSERDTITQFLLSRFPSLSTITSLDVVKSVNAEGEPSTPPATPKKARARKEMRNLHLSGTPGVGKTALVKEVVDDLFSAPASLSLSEKQRVDLVWVNCLQAGGTEGKIVAAVLDKVGLKSASQLGPYFLTHPTLLVLDELDSLPPILTSALSSSNSRTSLISISNSLLPLTLPQTLHLPFAPYPPTSLTSILTTLLRDEVEGKGFDENALKLLGRRVGKESGDLRRAREVAAKAIDVAEKRIAAQEKVDGVESVELKVTIADVQTALSASSSSSSSPSIGVAKKGLLDGLNLQGKIVLLSILLSSSSQNQGKEPYAVYKVLLRGEMDLLSPLSRGEYQDVISSLEGFGLLVSHDDVSPNSKSSLTTPLTPRKTPQRKKTKSLFGRSTSSSSISPSRSPSTTSLLSLSTGITGAEWEVREREKVEVALKEAKGEEGEVVRRCWGEWRRTEERKVLRDREERRGGEGEGERWGSKWRGEEEEAF